MWNVFSPKLLSRVFLAVALGVALCAGAAFAENVQEGKVNPVGPTKIAITIDDFPENGDLPPGVTRDQVAHNLIAALRDNGVLAPYGFANGNFMEWAPQEQSVIKLWLAAGHPLGNHTYDHPNLNEVGVQRFLESIEKEDKLLATIDTSPDSIKRRRMFRFPFMDEGDTIEKRDAVRNYLFKNGYQIAEVTTDYFDWAWNAAYNRCVASHDDKSAKWLIDHVGESADRYLRGANGSSEYLLKRRIPQILLIHINVFNSITLGGILKRWKDEGVTFVPLTEALSDPAYKINPNHAYDGGQTLFNQIAESRDLGIARFDDSTYTVSRLNEVCKASPTPKAQ